jgi:hypothetical protein
MEALRYAVEDHSRISFDCNDYRMLRIVGASHERLGGGGKGQAHRAPFFFNPMNSRERRVIHLRCAVKPNCAVRAPILEAHRMVGFYPAGDAQRSAASPAPAAAA